MDRIASTRLSLAAIALAILGTALSCSSAPKPQEAVYAKRNEAAKYLDLGAKNAREGATREAALFYGEAYRVSTAVDDAAGRVAALDGLATVYAAGVPETSAAAPADPTATVPDWGSPADAAGCRELASRLASESGSPQLMARASILEAEAALREASEEGARRAATLAASAAAALDSKSAERGRALRALGAARKAFGDFPGALSALDEAASLDLRQKRFAEFASDRYLAASVLSKAGDLPAARKALLEALENDRRAENSAGIGADYRALAMVAEKEGKKDEAAGFYRAARDVFSAARYTSDAQDADRRLSITLGGGGN